MKGLPIVDMVQCADDLAHYCFQSPHTRTAAEDLEIREKRIWLKYAINELADDYCDCCKTVKVLEKNVIDCRKKAEEIELAARNVITEQKGLLCFCAVVTPDDKPCALCELYDLLGLPNHGHPGKKD